jgi:5-methylcytosine-specific restriction enzyme A
MNNRWRGVAKRKEAGAGSKWPYNSARWLRLRAVKLMHDPICFACNLRGRAVVADTVDHIKPINSGGPIFPPLEGLMSLCHSCHSQKTQAVDRSDRWGNGRRFGGIDVDGNPVDPEDNWHGEGRVSNSKGPVSGPVSATNIDLFSHLTNQKKV